jgi:hypothetical protein
MRFSAQERLTAVGGGVQVVLRGLERAVEVLPGVRAMFFAKRYSPNAAATPIAGAPRTLRR